MQYEDTLAAMRFAGLTSFETWQHYCNAGGDLDYLEFDGYLHGVVGLHADDADLVSQAVNELIDDLGPEESQLCRAPYSSTPGSSAPEDFLGEVEETRGSWQALAEHAPVRNAVVPRSHATFGSRFLAGLDISGMTGTPGVPLPPGTTAELLGDILDSGVIGRTVTGERH